MCEYSVSHTDDLGGRSTFVAEKRFPDYYNVRSVSCVSVEIRRSIAWKNTEGTVEGGDTMEEAGSALVVVLLVVVSLLDHGVAARRRTLSNELEERAAENVSRFEDKV